MAQTVAIVSESYAARMRDSPPAMPPDLLISVTEARVPAALADVPVVFLAGLPESRAADLLIDRLNGRRPAESESAISTLQLSRWRPRSGPEHPGPQRQLHRSQQGSAPAAR